MALFYYYMNCNCIKNNKYNFSLIEQDCKTYLYQDLSEWVTLPNTDYIVKITPSGSTKQYDLVINAISRTGIITSELIGLGEDKMLPNGIYTFEFTICDKKFTKQELILCKLKCQYANMISSYSIKCDDLKNKKKFEEIMKYKLIFDSIEYNKRCCKWNKVKELTEYLTNILNGQNEKCGCM